MGEHPRPPPSNIYLYGCGIIVAGWFALATVLLLLATFLP
jgi:hypothetical protein